VERRNSESRRAGSSTECGCNSAYFRCIRSRGTSITLTTLPARSRNSLMPSGSTVKAIPGCSGVPWHQLPSSVWWM